MTNPAFSTRNICQVFVFDLDDTLYLERDFAFSGFDAVGAWVKAQLGIANFADTAKRHFDTGRRDRVFDATMVEIGIDPTPALISQMVQVYREHEPKITLAADAAEFLAQPQEHRAIAILTDGFLISQTNKLRALEIERFGVWPIVCTDVWGREFWKPHERGFKFIESAFHLPPDAFTYVADNPIKDFIAPRRLGWRAIQIVRTGRIHTAQVSDAVRIPDRCISSLREVGNL